MRNKKIKNNEEKAEMKKLYKQINKLVKDKKIKFSFYNSSRTTLDLLQLCHNKVDNTIEIEFRDVMSEYMEELKEIWIEKLKIKRLEKIALSLEINSRRFFMGIFYLQFKNIKLYNFTIKKALKPKYNETREEGEGKCQIWI